VQQMQQCPLDYYGQPHAVDEWLVGRQTLIQTTVD